MGGFRREGLGDLLAHMVGLSDLSFLLEGPQAVSSITGCIALTQTSSVVLVFDMHGYRANAIHQNYRISGMSWGIPCH